MKKCVTCKNIKPIHEFNIKSARLDRRQSVCRECSNAYSRWYYSENSERIKKQNNAARNKRRDTVRILAMEYLLNHPCVDCGESNPVVLEFDHLRDKSANISTMINAGDSWEKISDEIEKCEVRCCKCHRIKTALDGNWYRTK